MQSICPPTQILCAPIWQKLQIAPELDCPDAPAAARGARLLTAGSWPNQRKWRKINMEKVFFCITFITLVYSTDWLSLGHIFFSFLKLVFVYLGFSNLVSSFKFFRRRKIVLFFEISFILSILQFSPASLRVCKIVWNFSTNWRRPARNCDPIYH